MRKVSTRPLGASDFFFIKNSFFSKKFKKKVSQSSTGLPTDYVGGRSILNFPFKIFEIRLSEIIDFEKVKNLKFEIFKVDFDQDTKFQINFFLIKTEKETLNRFHSVI
jgi:hypothetical protein